LTIQNQYKSGWRKTKKKGILQVLATSIKLSYLQDANRGDKENAKAPGFHEEAGSRERGSRGIFFLGLNPT
jgi:hypothetical protein